MSTYIDGEKLKEHRLRLGLSVEQVGQMTGRTAATIERLEKAGESLPKLDAAALAARLGVHLADITGPPPPLRLTGADIAATLTGPADGAGGHNLAARMFGPTG